MAQSQPDQARRQLQQAIAIFQAATERSPLQVRALGLLARAAVQQAQGDGAAAQATLRAAQGQLQAALGDAAPAARAVLPPAV